METRQTEFKRARAQCRRAGTNPHQLGAALVALHAVLLESVRGWLGRRYPESGAARLPNAAVWQELERRTRMPAQAREVIGKVERICETYQQGGRFTGTRAQVLAFAKLVEHVVRQCEGPPPGRVTGIHILSGLLVVAGMGLLMWRFLRIDAIIAWMLRPEVEAAVEQMIVFGVLGIGIGIVGLVVLAPVIMVLMMSRHDPEHTWIYAWMFLKD
jgi:hypothetical protein